MSETLIAVCGWCGIDLPTASYDGTVMDDHAYTAAHFAGYHRAPGTSSVRFIYPDTFETDFRHCLDRSTTDGTR